MKRFHVIPALFISLFVATLATQAELTCKAQTSPAADKSAQVDALMGQLVQGDSPGAAVIVIKDGRVLHKKGYGYANLETKTPITPDTAFDLASVSKQFTAMAVMILAERGKLSFDDPLTKFFPQFADYARKITVRHLLNHTSGLPDYMQLFSREAKQGYQPSSKEMLDLLAKQPQPRFAPGDKWEYSNSGYLMLAMIVEKASGKPFPQFVKENIFQPLGMNDSLVYDHTRPAVKNRAISYARLESGFKNIDYHPLNLVYGDGAVNTSVEELYKWDQALYTEKLVKASTLKQAFTPGKLNNGTGTGYGFGWGVGKMLGLEHVSHGGGWVGFRTFITRYPSERFTVIVLSNYGRFNPGDTAQKIARIYLADRLTLLVAIKVDEEILKKYVGKYNIGGQNPTEVTFENGALWATSPAKKRKLLPESETRFFAEGEEQVRVTFNKDAEGKVTGLTLQIADATLIAKRAS